MIDGDWKNYNAYFLELRTTPLDDSEMNSIKVKLKSGKFNKFILEEKLLSI